MDRSKNSQGGALFSKSKHASVRSQQRAVSDEAIELALRYGEERFAGPGCQSIYIDKKSLRDIRVDVGPRRFAKLEQQLVGLYIVVKDDLVLTVARAH